MNPGWLQTLSQQCTTSVPSSGSSKSNDKPVPSYCSGLSQPPIPPNLNISDRYLQIYLKYMSFLHTILQYRIPNWSQTESIFIAGLIKVLYSNLIHGL
jgi:hypothetical protein